MAFSDRNLDPTGSASKGTKCHALYQEAVTAATMKGANYFDAGAEQMARVGSMTCYASDATFICKVSISAGVVTLAALDAF